MRQFSSLLICTVSDAQKTLFLIQDFLIKLETTIKQLDKAVQRGRTKEM